MDYVARQCGSTGHEIMADGEVIGWTVDSIWAARIVELLEMAAEGESSGCEVAVLPSHRNSHTRE